MGQCILFLRLSTLTVLPILCQEQAVSLCRCGVAGSALSLGMPVHFNRMWGFGLHWAWVPVVTFLVGLATIVTLLVIWLAEGHPRYRSDEDTVRAYIFCLCHNAGMHQPFLLRLQEVNWCRRSKQDFTCRLSTSVMLARHIWLCSEAWPYRQQCCFSSRSTSTST